MLQRDLHAQDWTAEPRSARRPKRRCLCELRVSATRFPSLRFL